MSGETISHNVIGSVQMSGEKMPSEKMLQRRLKYFFMNPCEKWKAKKKFPWKLILQIIKIIFVTFQLAMFGYSRSGHVDFIEKNNVAFKHLFLKSWSAAYETMPYPPSSGPFAVYTVPDFFASINYVLQRYAGAEALALASYRYDTENNTRPPVVLCELHFREANVWAFNETYVFHSEKVTDCIDVEPVEDREGKFVYDATAFLHSRNRSINFDRMLSVTLKFSLKTIHLRGLSTGSSPDCYRFDLEIEYENSGHNGQVAIRLTSQENALECHGTILHKTEEFYVKRVLLKFAFDTVVILVCALSLFLCLRSIFRAQSLRREAVVLFKEQYCKQLSWAERLEFLNMWYVLIIINDFMMVVGSVFKIEIENKVSHRYEACGVLLGTANLLVWIGFLRYLTFFRKYNVLILTMNKSVPNILRFLVCASVFYMSFTLCGWVVLGPYHIKFRSFSMASECLFSLINGDDMFNTFEGFTPPDGYIWWYCRIYLYVFISFFIYVVLSVFISIIMDTYETIKHCSEHGFPRSWLKRFADECTEHPTTLFRSQSDPDTVPPPRGCDGCLTMCMPCLRKRADSDLTDDEARLLA